MLDFEQPVPPHRKAMYEAPGCSVRFSNIIDELGLTVLLNNVNDGDPHRSSKATAVPKVDFSRIFTLGSPVFEQILEFWIENVEDEETTRLQMPMDCL